RLGHRYERDRCGGLARQPWLGCRDVPGEIDPVHTGTPGNQNLFSGGEDCGVWKVCWGIHRSGGNVVTAGGKFEPVVSGCIRLRETFENNGTVCRLTGVARRNGEHADASTGRAVRGEHDASCDTVCNAGGSRTDLSQ